MPWHALGSWALRGSTMFHHVPPHSIVGDIAKKPHIGRVKFVEQLQQLHVLVVLCVGSGTGKP